MFTALRDHWPEYLIEAWGLGMFMVSAGGFATLLYAPSSPAPGWFPNLFLRGTLMGIAMGLTAIAIIYSPWGKRSGAHINPAVTLAFFRLKKLAPWDALFYVVSQFIGGLAGVLLVAVLVGEAFTSIPVNYVVTVPGIWGWLAALMTEALMSFGLMLMVLGVSNHPRWNQYTGVFSGVLVATYISLAAPISGMSINPARTFASSLPAQVWTGFWIYYIAPPLAMLAATEIYLSRSQRPTRQICGKLCPNTETGCIAPECGCVAFERKTEGMGSKGVMG
ncbi:MAG: aquaporin [Cyanobacteria bacterium P01_A01_bin.123]